MKYSPMVFIPSFELLDLSFILFELIDDATKYLYGLGLRDE